MSPDVLDSYAVMRQTWHADPLQRPSFSQLVPVMATFLETSATQVHLSHPRAPVFLLPYRSVKLTILKSRPTFPGLPIALVY